LLWLRHEVPRQAGLQPGLVSEVPRLDEPELVVVVELVLSEDVEPSAKAEGREASTSVAHITTRITPRVRI